MLISKQWLSDHIDLSGFSNEEIAEKLTMIGLEVDGVTSTGSDFESFVAGLVTTVNPHPNADKLRLCHVDIGEKTLQIVCGAPNVAEGQIVPVALPGAVIPATMPDGSKLTIRKSKLRGEVSEGMICSEVELDIGDDHSGILVLDEDIKVGTPLASIFGSTKDTIFEIALTPNRPDAASHMGVARDLSAAFGRDRKGAPSDTPAATQIKIAKSETDLSGIIEISILDPDKCARYTAMVIEGVQIGPSPEWLKTRLTSIGLRSVNNVVDVTNYVLHDMGQPLHAFDMDRIRGREIVVRSFDTSQTFETLDGVKREVPAGTLFICDGDGPVAIAGVMGGANSEVTHETTTILLESAWFDPSHIRKASKSIQLQTDSSYRFERGIDPMMQFAAAAKAASMICELAGGTVRPECTDLNPIPHKSVTVHLRPSRVDRILGTDLTTARIQDILERLEIRTQETQISDGEEVVLECTIPSFRPDLEREIDLIEEVGRILDYNSIPAPDASVFVNSDPLPEWERFKERMRDLVMNLGYREIAGNSLLSKQEASVWLDEKLQIETLNPVSHETTTLRPVLASGFLRNAAFNLNRRNRSVRFFEMGQVFQRATKEKPGRWIAGVSERTSLLLGLSGIRSVESWNREELPFTRFDLKSDLAAFFKRAGIKSVLLEDVISSSELHYYLPQNDDAEKKHSGTPVAKLMIPEKEKLKLYGLEETPVFFAEIDLTALFDSGFASDQIRFRKIPKVPSFEFDAAFLVDASVRVGSMMVEIRNCKIPTLKEIRVFDIYEGDRLGKGKKSVAFRLTFLDPLKTLNINDVEPSVKIIEKALTQRFEARLRSE